MSSELNYRESRLADGTRVVTFRGELDLSTAGPVLEELLEECVESASHVVLDFSEVDFMDSAGLGLLVKTERGLSAVGRRLVVTRPHANVRRILELTGLDQRLAIADTWSEGDPL
jgi:anti-anti-sigma factor